MACETDHITSEAAANIGADRAVENNAADMEPAMSNKLVNGADLELSKHGCILTADEKTAETANLENGGDENGGGTAGAAAEASSRTMSRREQKRALKRKLWLEQRPERRAKEKEKRKQKMERMVLTKEFVESRSATRKRLKHEQVMMKDSSCKVGVVFDMQFAGLMHQKDLGKCVKQLMKCYSINRRLPAPLQLYITSFHTHAKNEMEKNDGYQNWDLHFREQLLSECLEPASLIYLTSDSDNVLSDLEPGKNYVIGGLVDHNNLKGICWRRANELGLSHARLPIDEYIHMKTRRVLTVNHVFEILVAVTKGSSWKEAFLSVIPQRKGAEEKEDSDT